jgi:hypothetical protein
MGGYQTDTQDTDEVQLEETKTERRKLSKKAKTATCSSEIDKNRRKKVSETKTPSCSTEIGPSKDAPRYTHRTGSVSITRTKDLVKTEGQQVIYAR